MIKIQPVMEQQRKSQICETILRALPAWFGIEAAIQDYVRDAANLTMQAAFQKSTEPLGFISVKQHNPYAAELYVLGVLPTQHRKGIGRALLEQCESDCRKTGIQFLTVKTLDASANSAEYDRTRLFYRAMGFVPLEVFPLLWDKNNPCLFMAKFITGNPTIP